MEGTCAPMGISNLLIPFSPRPSSNPSLSAKVSLILGLPIGAEACVAIRSKRPRRRLGCPDHRAALGLTVMNSSR